MCSIRQINKKFNKSGQNDKMGDILSFHRQRHNFLNSRNKNRSSIIFQGNIFQR